MGRPRVTGSQLALLGREPNYRRLFLATLGSGAGTWLALVALEVDIWEHTHSSGWIAALLIADMLPTFAIGILVGPLIDRLSRRRLMVSADLVRFGVFAALPFTTSATADRRPRRGGRDRDRLLQAGRLRRAAEPRPGRGPPERQRPPADGGQPHLGARLARRRRAGRGLGRRCGLLDQRLHVPDLGRLPVRDPAAAAAGVRRREPRPLAGPEGRLLADRPLEARC